METLYRAFNSVTKPIVDKAAGGSFIDLSFLDASDILNRMTKKSQAQHTRDFVVDRPTVAGVVTAEQRRRDEERN